MHKTDKKDNRFAPIPDIDLGKLEEDFRKNQEERIEFILLSADIVSGARPPKKED